MKQRSAIGRIGGYAEEVAAAMRRRNEKRKPRVRVRVGHAEPVVLTDDSSQGARLQTLCQAIVDAERSAPRV
jgi:succinyl-CoA synthetase alpha subunit